MNELQVFTNEQFGNVRTLTEGETVLFCGTDVASVLGYQNTRDAISRHCRGVVKRDVPTTSGEQEMSFITEGDVYRLIVRSNLPAAESFERWVFEEVLPAVRKHGMYAKDELLDNPDLLIEVATKLKEERAARKQLEAQNAALLPKGEYYDALVDRNGLTNLRDTAKLLNVPPLAFTEALIDDGYIYRTSKGEHRFYAESNKGYFTVKEYVRNGHAGIQVLVTVKGREHFMRLYAKKLA